MSYIDTVKSILDQAKTHRSNVSPSEWYEQNMVMPKGSAMAGKFTFDHTPFWREPLDCASPYHPAKEISIMKGAQVGGTTAVLNPIVGYTIAVNPGNMMFLTGHSDLSKDAMDKIDLMIDNAGIRGLIGHKDLRARNTRTGDTLNEKKFYGGYLKMGSVTNHNLLRQHDIMIMIVDDYDAAAGSSKYAGATRELVQKRTTAYRHKKKIYWVSSPQVEGRSNIEEVFNLSDQRYYHVPCPCCGDFIILKWNIEVDERNSAGIYYETDDKGTVIRDSVGYICQSCAGFFDDTKKYDMNLAGFWKPTADAKEEDHYGYHISSLYSPPFMDPWAHYAQQYVNANPSEGARHEKKHQTFVNVVLGETYQQAGKSPNANELMKNIRPYEIGIIPESISERDGNGKIMLLTCACDINGKLDDARLDYEIVAWSENGSSYSIDHGSIGTFIYAESKKKNVKDRYKWTYEIGKERNVWDEFDKVIGKIYDTDTGRKMKVFMTGVDTGFLDKYAWEYVDKSNFAMVGLKGDPQNFEKYTRDGIDMPRYKVGKSRSGLFTLESNMYKDDVSDRMALKWSDRNNNQPSGFMNFPTPNGNKYRFDNFFGHFESEKRVLEEQDGKAPQWVWVVKNRLQMENHQWDCFNYNLAMRDIVIHLWSKELKQKDFTWTDYVNAVLGKK